MSIRIIGLATAAFAIVAASSAPVTATTPAPTSSAMAKHKLMPPRRAVAPSHPGAMGVRAKPTPHGKHTPLPLKAVAPSRPGENGNQ